MNLFIGYPFWYVRNRTSAYNLLSRQLSIHGALCYRIVDIHHCIQFEGYKLAEVLQTDRYRPSQLISTKAQHEMQ